MAAPVQELATTDDLFLGDRLVIRQPVSGYRAGTDAVMLASALNFQSPLNVLDVGAGVGTIGLCIASRLVHARITLFERESELVALAKWNIARNDFQDRMAIVLGDVGRYPGHHGKTDDQLQADRLQDDSFDVVVSNPPFYEPHLGTSAAGALRATSRALHDVTLDDWVRFMTRMTKPGGACLIVHKAERLPQLLSALDGRFGRIIVTPLHARENAPAGRVLLSGIKGNRAPMTLHPGLVLHDDGNSFVPEIDAVMRCGASLPGPPLL